jgi:hypothetical protein
VTSAAVGFSGVGAAANALVATLVQRWNGLGWEVVRYGPTFPESPVSNEVFRLTQAQGTFDPGTYTLTKPLDWTGKRITVEADQVRLLWNGTDKSAAIVTVGGKSGQNIDGIVVRGLKVEPDIAWVHDARRNTAIRVQNVTHSQFYGLSSSRTYTGIEFRGEGVGGSCHYNTLVLGRVYNCHDGIVSSKGADGKGYVITGTIIGGEIAVDSGVTSKLAVGDMVRLFSCPATGSSWTLVGPVFQSAVAAKTIYADINSRNCLLMNPYFECADEKRAVVKFGPQSRENRIIGGVRMYADVKDDGQGNRWE